MTAYNRRYDIDWLRVIAIGLLLIYHIAIAFQPWGVFIGFIQNSESLDWLWIPMSMLNVWRIPLLFFISGMGVFLAIRRRNIRQLLLERSKRILVPFIFGMIAIVPLHIFIWQHYYHQDLGYVFNPGHLWFLGNIFVYVLILAPLLFWLKKHPENWFRRGLNVLFSHPAGILVIAIPFILEAFLVNPESFELYALTWHGFWLGFAAFFCGYCLMYSGSIFWQSVDKSRWYFFVVALGMYLIRLVVFNMKSPNILIAIESVLWVITIFAFAHRNLNRDGKLLRYLSSAAYPVYIVHMVFLYLGSVLLFGLDIPAVAKLALLVIFTGVGCFGGFELIRRTKYLRILFGLKGLSKFKSQTAPESPSASDESMTLEWRTEQH